MSCEKIVEVLSSFLCEIRNENGNKVYRYASVEPMDFEATISVMEKMPAPLMVYGVLLSPWLQHRKGTRIEFSTDKRFCIVRPG